MAFPAASKKKSDKRAQVTHENHENFDQHAKPKELIPEDIKIVRKDESIKASELPGAFGGEPSIGEGGNHVNNAQTKSSTVNPASAVKVSKKSSIKKRPDLRKKSVVAKLKKNHKQKEIRSAPKALKKKHHVAQTKLSASHTPAKETFATGVPLQRFKQAPKKGEGIVKSVRKESHNDEPKIMDEEEDDGADDELSGEEEPVGSAEGSTRDLALSKYQIM